MTDNERRVCNILGDCELDRWELLKMWNQGQPWLLKWDEDRFYSLLRDMEYRGLLTHDERAVPSEDGNYTAYYDCYSVNQYHSQLEWDNLAKHYPDINEEEVKRLTALDVFRYLVVGVLFVVSFLLCILLVRG